MAYSWSGAKLGDALDAIARHAALARVDTAVPNPPASIASGDSPAQGPWIEHMAAARGFEAELVDAPITDLVDCLRKAAPALLRLPEEPARFLLLVSATRRRLRVLCPDRRVRAVPLAAVAARLRQPLEAPLAAEVSAIADLAALTGRARESAVRALVDDRLVLRRVGGCWILRASASSSLWSQVRCLRVGRRIAIVAGSHAAVYILIVLSWWLIGHVALTGLLDSARLFAWALLLLTIVPLRVIGASASGLLAIDIGALFKRQLLRGALSLNVEKIKHQGPGPLLSRVTESDALESVALNGGVLGLTASIELAFAAIVLALGPGGAPQAASLIAWLAVVGATSCRYLRKRRTWTQARLDITDDLVERMIGHRTRLVQENERTWHDEEDRVLRRYVDVSTMMDRTAVIQAILPRAWLIVGLAGLAPSFISGSASAGAIATGLGGVLLAYRALLRLVPVVNQLTGVAVAVEQVETFLREREEELAVPSLFDRAHPRQSESGNVSIEARDLSYRYPDRPEPVLRGCSLRIGSGERVLVEGGSGKGKSTLASILAGLRNADTGLLLVGGLDRQSLGLKGWRRYVAAAPQFHENHVFVGSLAFNLLSGRRWPPTDADLRDAHEICVALGLGYLLDRMPGGVLQMVGEMGWQLSHGERSRIYIARALLQNAGVVILDESFAALDPKTLRTCMAAVRSRASSVLVIAHP